MKTVKKMAPLLIAFLKVGGPAAAGAFGLWLATAAPDIYRAVCLS